MPFCATKSRIDRLKDPIPSVSCMAPRAGTEDVLIFYDLPGTSIDTFLVGVARTQGLMRRFGQALSPYPRPTTSPSFLFSLFAEG